MSDMHTPRLALPLLQPGQAQKEMLVNEAVSRLDIAVQGMVDAAGVDAPPADPDPGDCWIVGGAPGGDWAGHAHEIAGWTSSGWLFVQPREGTQIWIGSTGSVALFTGGVWRLGELHGKLFVGGNQVVGPRQTAIAEPSGGSTVDAEARTAIASVLEALRAHGLIEGE
jgi:hypothetical protein